MKEVFDFERMSAQECEMLSIRARLIAMSRRLSQPTREAAFVAGIQNMSYFTPARGLVESYAGEAVVTDSNGKRWKVVGHQPKGDVGYTSVQGYIEFKPLPEEGETDPVPTTTTALPEDTLKLFREILESLRGNAHSHIFAAKTLSDDLRSPDAIAVTRHWAEEALKHANVMLEFLTSHGVKDLPRPMALPDWW
jgi:hypothetical protein